MEEVRDFFNKLWPGAPVGYYPEASGSAIRLALMEPMRRDMLSAVTQAIARSS